MKTREKKYLFEGFLNVMIISFVGIAVGFACGLATGVTAGINSAMVATTELCLFEKLGYTIQKN